MEKIKICIIGDDPVWLSVFIKFLKKERDFIIVCASAIKNEIFEFIVNDEPDILLVDLNPGTNKWESSELIKNLVKSRKRMKIIVLTSSPLEKDVLEAFLWGVSNYLYKDDYESIPYSIRSSFKYKLPVEILALEYLHLSQIKAKFLFDFNCESRNDLSLLDKTLIKAGCIIIKLLKKKL